jgi:hypothetical protein
MDRKVKEFHEVLVALHGVQMTTDAFGGLCGVLHDWRKKQKEAKPEGNPESSG